MAPSSQVRATFQDQELFNATVSGAEINAVLADLLQHAGAEIIVVTTPGWGVHVYENTCYGMFQGMGYTEDEAQAIVNAAWQERDDYNAAHAFIGLDAQGNEVYGVHNAHLLAFHAKRDWDYDPDMQL